MKQPFTDRVKEWFRTRLKPPIGVQIALGVLPAVLIILFYILRPVQGAMNWTSAHISRPVRGFFGMIYSIYPISIMELLCTAGVIFLIYYIVKAIRDCSRRRNKWKLLGKRALFLLIGIAYIFSMWCWMWSVGYHTSGFAKNSGLISDGVDTADLLAVTELFAEKANELSTQLTRDEDGSLTYIRGEVFDASRNIYRNAARQYPLLRGTVYEPKPMYFYSWLMTITGYTGVYFALTGESMVNIQQHPAYMPATIAHEQAHQLGVYAEDEASFVGILACVTSDDPIYQYSGYLLGLGYLSNALAVADTDEYQRIMSELSDEVKLDRAQNAAFWANASKSSLGVGWLDNVLTSIMSTTDNVVDSVYDNYLKSQSQELGLQSYGACVDLLVAHFTAGKGLP